MIRAAAIVNSRAGAGRTGRLWARLGPHAAVETCFTKGPGHAAALAGELAGRGFERILSVGGDGTLNEIAGGLLAAGAAGRVAIGVLPAGAGSDFARSLGLPADPRDAFAALLEAQPRAIDAALARFRAPDGRPGERYFINMASFGLGAEATRRAAGVPFFRGRARYALAALAAFPRHRAARVQLTANGASLPLPPVLHVAVGNGRFQGGGMQMCPGAALDDGLLDITAIADLSARELARDFRVLYSADIHSHPRVRHWRVEQLGAESRGAVPFELDGEAVGTLPVVIRVLPGVLRFLVCSSTKVLPSGGQATLK